MLAGLAVPAAAAPRVAAEVLCRPTDEALVYRCFITVIDRRSGAPVSGARLVIGADMPTMPMAHHVAPVEAVPGDTPGAYHATIRLEMLGRWALTIRVSGPVTDQVVHVAEFWEPTPPAGGHGGGHGGGPAPRN